ncbi:MAG: hypothetical protein AAB360_00100 [Patescibacteria group bacterium]
MHKRNKSIVLHIGFFLFFIIIAFWINAVPPDRFIAGGDFYQLIDPAEHFGRYFYAWINQIGQGAYNNMWVDAPFYSLLAVLDYFGASSGVIGSFYLFFLLYGSFLSFYFSVNLILSKISKEITIWGGLVYALNNFTLTIFTYPWGFTHHFLFYIFIPPLVALPLKIILAPERGSNYALFSLVLLLSLLAFNNLAFLGALLPIYFLMLSLLLIFCKEKVRINIELCRKISKIAAIYFVVLLPAAAGFYFSSIASTVSLGGIATSAVISDLEGWITATSSDFVNSFFFAVDKYRFPMATLGSSVILSASYMIILVGLMVKYAAANYRNRKERLTGTSNHNLTIVFILIFLLLITLSVRAYGPVKEMNLSFYLLPLFSFFRSPEKLFSFIPFVYLMVLLGLILELRIRKWPIRIIFLLLLLIPHPFYTGKIVGMLSNKGSDYSYVQKIPAEYESIRGTVNNGSKSTSVISLPFSVVNSINWANYPKWGFVGQDILHLLFDKNYISANTFDHPNAGSESSFENFDRQKRVDTDRLIYLIQKFSGEYVIFHRDIDKRFSERSKVVSSTLKKLEDQKVVDKINENGLFDLYRVSPEYIRPVISFQGNVQNVEFARVNPVKYKIRLTGLSGNGAIVLNQSFNSQWSAFVKKTGSNHFSCGGEINYSLSKTKECVVKKDSFFEWGDAEYAVNRNRLTDHFLSDEYANGWILTADDIRGKFSTDYYKENPDGSLDLEVVLFFLPQFYIYLQVILSLIILAFASAILSRRFKGRGD